MADWQAKTEGVAVSVLMVQDRTQFPTVAKTTAPKSPPGEAGFGEFRNQRRA
jgi:hypothetical protein